MTPLSRWKLSEKEEERIKKLLVERLAIIGDKDEMEEFLRVILTETELFMVAKRMIAILLFEMNKNDVEVSKLLHVTRSTASRFRMVYKFGKDKQEVAKVVKDLKTNKEVNEFLGRLKEYLVSAPFGRIPRKSVF